MGFLWGTNGHHYLLLLSQWVYEGIFLSRLGQNEHDDSIICGAVLHWVSRASCSVLSALVPSEPAQANLPCRFSLLPPPPSLEPASSVSHGFSCVPDFLQWYRPRLTFFRFIRNSTSFHPAPQVCFPLPSHIFIYSALPLLLNSKVYAAVFRG